jgi:hypothetical protein
MCSFDVGTDGVVRAIRQLGPALVKEGADETIGVALFGHAGRSLESEGVRASASRLARNAVVA